jgi:hypothetical protein
MKSLIRQVKDEVEWKVVRYIKFNCKDKIRKRVHEKLVYKIRQEVEQLDTRLLNNVFFRIADELGGLPIIRNRSLLG